MWTTARRRSTSLGRRRSSRRLARHPAPTNGLLLGRVELRVAASASTAPARRGALAVGSAAHGAARDSPGAARSRCAFDALNVTRGNFAAITSCGTAVALHPGTPRVPRSSATSFRQAGPAPAAKRGSSARAPRRPRAYPAMGAPARRSPVQLVEASADAQRWRGTIGLTVTSNGPSLSSRPCGSKQR